LPRTDDGEFELVLGNKQLLSVFFIMVVLLGVFFAMGYIAGRNSAPGASDVAKKGDTGKPIVVDNPQRNSPMPDAGGQAAQPGQPAGDAGTTTQPAAGSQPPPQQEQTPQPPAEAPHTEPVAPAPRPAPPREASPTQVGGAPRVAEPEAGTVYLQVVATARPEADVIAGTLSKRGYRTQLSQAPTAGTFRVLVGPLKDASDIARTRADLEKAGFKPIVRRF
jgi:cell division protein FtsN